MPTTRYCIYPGCKSDSRQNCKPYMKNVFFIPFPKPKTKYHQCVRWLRLCDKTDPSTVKPHWFVCSNHFVDGKGPTEEHPDPIQYVAADKPKPCDIISDLAVSFGWSYGKDGETQVFSRIQSNTMLACLRVKSCGEITLVVYGKEVPAEHDVWESIPKILLDLSNEGIKQVLQKLKEWTFCNGNMETKFLKIFSSKTHSGVGFQCSNGIEPCIRSKKCLGLYMVNSQRQRCLPCSLLRKTLRDSFHNEKKKKQKSLQGSKKEKNKYQHPALKKDDFFKMQAHNIQSLKEIFKEQKKRNAKTKGRRGVKWHPDIIQWCRALRSQSPKNYETLRKTGFGKFPSRMTLFRHTTYSSRPGFNDDAFKELVELIGKSGVEEHRKYVCVVWDEVKTKEKLDYVPKSGEFVGFLPKPSREEKEQPKDVSLATHVFQIMVRGITSDIKFPLAFFPSNNLPSTSIYSVIWEAVMKLETSGVKVLAFVSDGAASNRIFFQTSAEEGAPHYHKTRNPFAMDEPRDN